MVTTWPRLIGSTGALWHAIAASDVGCGVRIVARGCGGGGSLLTKIATHRRVRTYGTALGLQAVKRAMLGDAD